MEQQIKIKIIFQETLIKTIFCINNFFTEMHYVFSSNNGVQLKYLIQLGLNIIITYNIFLKLLIIVFNEQQWKLNFGLDLFYFPLQSILFLPKYYFSRN